MKVLVITRNLPPLVGGMERLLHNLVLGAAEYAEVTVIGPTGCREYLPDTVATHECSNKLAGFLVGSTLTALRIVRRGRFDVVIGGSGLIAPLLLLLKTLFRCRTLILVHGLDIIVDHWLYQRLFIPTLRRADQVVANSRNTKRLAVEKGVPEERITIIHPGTHIPELPDEDRKREFLQRYRIPYSRYMLFAGRITRRKGLSPFIRNSLPAILQVCPDAGLVVVGDNAGDSLNRQGEKAEVMAAIDETGLTDEVMFLGQVDDQDLETAYACATVHLFPLIDVPGDVEGFGMVAIEAAAMGTPTVAFQVGGVEDAVLPSGGNLVEIGQYEQLREAVSSFLQDTDATTDAYRKHAKRFEWSRFNREIRPLVCST
ncbi:glycosyltransferase family 4 protein [Haliea sp. E1-2-M8]|uniref:glycosyltransferase family 4 protein n=1 Tax=Haliea sp. E1-2-M8 TaxID=3064706 RepID=UPI002717A28D|nr:glycosyltransferase family 4 protein [Haliea sp. E1-2-M8]MDO8863365.1 glycosyltransferase family 4 protein [Haliea sp. E1-2-M8]